MPADITGSHGTENRITNGMDKDIRIGMPLQTHLMGDLHTPKNKPPSRNQPVAVIAKANSHGTVTFRVFIKSSARRRSSGVVILMFS